jgi:ParB-like chromosome segregation protein Spo0J
MTEKVVRKNVSDLKCSHFVRMGLDPDRVNFFVRMYQGNHDIPPIKVEDETNEIVDGRHRKAALELLQRKTIDCLITPRYENRAELLMDAHAENLGGSLPHTYNETVFLVKQLIESGLKTSQIGVMLAPYYPSGSIKKIVDDAYSAVNSARMVRARKSVASGTMSIEDAADYFKLKLPALRKEVAGERKKREEGPVSRLKLKVSNRSRAYIQSMNLNLRILLENYDGGEVTEAQVKEVLRHYQKLYLQAGKALNGWEERFNARKKGMENKP